MFFINVKKIGSHINRLVFKMTLQLLLAPLWPTYIRTHRCGSQQVHHLPCLTDCYSSVNHILHLMGGVALAEHRIRFCRSISGLKEQKPSPDIYKEVFRPENRPGKSWMESLLSAIWNWLSWTNNQTEQFIRFYHIIEESHEDKNE